MESHDLLTTEDCIAVLQNCLKQKSCKVTSHTVESLSDKIEGFLGQHFVVTIYYEDKIDKLKSQRCFMKVLNGASKLLFEISQSLNAYAKEEFLYTVLLKEFEKYKIDTSFSPNVYFCKPYLLVLEDMSLSKFVGVSRGPNLLDLNHCKLGLRTLAKFHAGGFLYEMAKSSEQGTPYSLVDQYPQMFQDMIFANDDNLARKWFEHTVQGIFQLIPVISNEYNVIQEEFSKRLQQAIEDNTNLVDYLKKFKGTILHGDVWYNNFLFKYVHNVVKESILVDYQLMKYGPPSVDVLHFLYANTRKKLRDEYFYELIDFYYNELEGYFPKDGLQSTLPIDQYLKLCTELQIIIKLQCICDRCVTLLGDVAEADNVAEDDSLRLDLFNIQWQRILSCFEKNPMFKEIIAEDMLELYAMLVKP